MEHDQTIEYYRQRAAEYDKIYFRDVPARQAELAGLYAVSRRALAGRRVLDLACGTGFWTKIIAEKAASVMGVDINLPPLREAMKKSYLCHVSLICGGMFQLPFREHSFDGLLATFVLSHVKREEMALLADAIRPLLVPGAPAFFCDNNLICEMIPELEWDEKHCNSYKLRRLEDGRQYRILKNYFQSDELEEIFHAWGRLESLTYNPYYWSAVLTLR